MYSAMTIDVAMTMEIKSADCIHLGDFFDRKRNCQHIRNDCSMELRKLFTLSNLYSALCKTDRQPKLKCRIRSSRRNVNPPWRWKNM
jgi:hypothetical protein